MKVFRKMHYYTSQSHAILHILHITVFLRTTSNVFSSAKFFCSRDVSDAITQREVIYRLAIFLFVMVFSSHTKLFLYVFYQIVIASKVKSQEYRNISFTLGKIFSFQNYFLYVEHSFFFACKQRFYMLFAYRFYILCAYRPWHKSHIIQGFTIGFVLRKLMIAQQYKKKLRS